jgi:hypothetical protein
VFVLAGTGGAMLLAAALERDRRRTMLTAGVAVVWVVSFGIEYVTSIRHLSHLAAGAQAASTGQGSVLKNIYVIFSEPGALPRTLVGLTALFVAVGAIMLGRTSWRRLAALAFAAIAAALVAAANRYPLSGRWELFLLPFAVLLLSLGGCCLVRSTRMPAKAAVAGAVAVLLVVPAWKSLREFAKLPPTEAGTPSTLQPTKHLLARLAGLWQPGDTLYVGVKSQYAFRYYLTCHDCNAHQSQEAPLWPFRPIPGPTQESPALIPARASLVVGSYPGDLENYLGDFARLRGKSRVWFLFTHTAPIDEATLEFWLNREGHQLLAIREGTAAVLLYDLRRTATRFQPQHH